MRTMCYFITKSKQRRTRPERRLLRALRLILIAIQQCVLPLRQSPQFIAKCALSGCAAIVSGQIAAGARQSPQAIQRRIGKGFNAADAVRYPFPIGFAFTLTWFGSHMRTYCYYTRKGDACQPFRASFFRYATRPTAVAVCTYWRRCRPLQGVLRGFPARRLFRLLIKRAYPRPPPCACGGR